jgi:hypothetical protein
MNAPTDIALKAAQNRSISRWCRAIGIINNGIKGARSIGYVQHGEIRQRPDRLVDVPLRHGRTACTIK